MKQFENKPLDEIFKYFVYFVLTLGFIAQFCFADTPPQVINKTCSSNQYFNKIAPGPNNITCAQPTYSGLSGLPTYTNSISFSSGNVSLLNDAPAPGTGYYYGTNGSGVKGYFALAGSVVEAWGNIVGTLSNQTDLQSALDAKQNSLTIGNLTEVGTDGITITGGTGSIIGSGTSISQHISDATHAGYLSSTDWSTFNGKQASGNYLTALTGDGSASGPGSAALTLATVNTQPGLYGDASHAVLFQVNGKGLITVSNSTPIIIAESQVTNLVSDLAGKQATGNYITALTGDVTASGPGSSAATLATVNSNVGSFGSSTSIPSVTVNAKGLVTAASGNAVIAPAGTLSGATLASGVTASSLTSIGSLSIPITQAQQATPANPSAGFNKLYFKSGGGLFTLDSAGTEIQLASSTGVVNAIGTIDSQTASTNGAVISGSTLVMQSASSTRPGLINNTNQTFAGPKIFTNDLATGGNFTFSTESSGLTLESANIISLFVAGVSKLRVNASNFIEAVSLPIVANAFIPASATIPSRGIYLPATNTVGFATNTTFAGSVDANQQWTFGTVNASGIHHNFYKDVNSGDTTNPVSIYIGNSGTAQGVVRQEWTNQVASGAPSFRITHRPRNNANSNDINAARIEMFKKSATDAGYIQYSTNIAGSLTLTQTMDEFGNFQINNVGGGLQIKEGSNAKMGVCTLVLGTCTVSNTAVTANSRIWLTHQNLSTITVPVGLAISARSAGVSFTILSGNLTDTSVIAWQMIEPL